MNEAELTAKIDGLNAEIERVDAEIARLYDKVYDLHDKRRPFVKRLNTDFGPGPVCTSGGVRGCDEPETCRPRGVCRHGAPPTEEQERKKKAKYLRPKIKKLMDALRCLQEHEPRLVVRLVSGQVVGKEYYSLFLDVVGKDLAMLEQLRDAKSSPDSTVRTRKRRAADPAQTQAEEERRNQAHADEQAQLKDKVRLGAELKIGDVQEEISRRWKVEIAKPAYVVWEAFRAFMNQALDLRGYDPELVVSSLGTEQYELFMSEVDGYIQTLKALRAVQSLPTRSRLQIV